MTGSNATSVHVLVVEDDPLVRMLAVAIVVADAECDVLHCANADEAIKLLDAHPEITVLFTDIDMPGSMKGLRLAETAKAMRPDLVVVIASGHLKPGALLPQGSVFFPKPYTPTEIISAIKGPAG